MKLVDLYKQVLKENSSSTYEYGCAMIYFTFPELEQIQSLIMEVKTKLKLR